MDNTLPHPSVFISYSWDSEDHKRWVREFSSRLVANGVVVRLDQWEIQPGDSLTAFMEMQLSECDHTIIICTPNYASKSIERKGGVGYEQQIISGRIATGVHRRKFIPVVRHGAFEAGDECAIPPHFLGIYAVDMRDSTNFDSSFEILLRAIYKTPKIAEPLLGDGPDFLKLKPVPTRAVRLPSLEFDGWELQSGVASAEHHPATFKIPTLDERSSIQAGDVVKLHFAVSLPATEDDEAEISHERMWVIVKGSVGPYLWGVLDNEPSFGDEHPDLKIESEVIFLPEHILDIADLGAPSA